MTNRANRIVDMLKREGDVAGLSPEVLLRILRARGLRPSEVGWVLHHVLDVSMPEAVHRATAARVEREGALSIEAPLPAARREAVYDDGTVRLVVG